MRRIHLGIAAAALALALTGCGSDDSDTADNAGNSAPTSAAPPGSSPTAVTPEQQASIMSAAGIPPKPDAATEAAYVAALNRIDPDIAHGKVDKAVSRGRDTCRSIKDNAADPTKTIEITQKRWTSPDHPEGRSATVAAQIITVTREHLCPT